MVAMPKSYTMVEQYINNALPSSPDQRSERNDVAKGATVVELPRQLPSSSILGRPSLSIPTPQLPFCNYLADIPVCTDSSCRCRDIPVAEYLGVFDSYDELIHCFDDIPCDYVGCKADNRNERCAGEVDYTALDGNMSERGTDFANFTPKRLRLEQASGSSGAFHGACEGGGQVMPSGRTNYNSSRTSVGTNVKATNRKSPSGNGPEVTICGYKGTIAQLRVDEQNRMHATQDLTPVTVLEQENTSSERVVSEGWIDRKIIPRKTIDLPTVSNTEAARAWHSFCQCVSAHDNLGNISGASPPRTPSKNRVSSGSRGFFGPSRSNNKLAVPHVNSTTQCTISPRIPNTTHNVNQSGGCLQPDNSNANLVMARKSGSMYDVNSPTQRAISPRISGTTAQQFGFFQPDNSNANLDNMARELGSMCDSTTQWAISPTRIPGTTHNVDQRGGAQQFGRLHPDNRSNHDYEDILLWHFLVDELCMSSNSRIEWVRGRKNELVFKILDTDALAKQWYNKKPRQANHSPKYANMARSLRMYKDPKKSTTGQILEDTWLGQKTFQFRNIRIVRDYIAAAEKRYPCALLRS